MGKSLETLLIFFGMALATFFTRYASIAVLGRETSGAQGAQDGEAGAAAPGQTTFLYRWLRYVPAAVLAALIVPPVLAPQGHLEIGPPVWALLGGAVAWRTRSVLWTILGGMAVFWVLSVLGL